MQRIPNFPSPSFYNDNVYVNARVSSINVSMQHFGSFKQLKTEWLSCKSTPIKAGSFSSNLVGFRYQSKPIVDSNHLDSSSSTLAHVLQIYIKALFNGQTKFIIKNMHIYWSYI